MTNYAMKHAVTTARIAALDGGPDVLSFREACAYLRVGAVALRRAALAGEVPAMRVGPQWRFSRARLEEALRDTTPKLPAAGKVRSARRSG